MSVLLSGLLVVLLLPGWAQASDVAGRPADGIVTVDGRGFGHGRGMSQHGAYGAALQGLTYDQILSFYYSGTVLSDAPGARRRVLLTAEDNDAVVGNVPGLTVQAGGVSYRTGDRSDWTLVRSFVDGSALRVHALQGGTWVDVPGLASTAGPVTFSGALLGLNSPAGVRTYRGVLTTSLSGQPGKPLYVVNDVSIDEYVRGVVAAEMPASWHAQALRAQAVAARSYGLQPCPQPGPYPTTALYDVVDTTACQVYGGATAEAATTNQAVADTSGKVLRYGGAVLRTEFSSSNGGWTVAAGGAYVAKEDPYDVIGAQAGRSTVNRWTAVRFGADRLENAFGTGLLTNIQVVARDGRGEWGGRVLKVRLVGAARSVEVTGEQFRSAAGLRSSWFSLVSPIDAKHAQLGGDSGVLGPANGPEQPLAAGGRFRSYRSGAIFWIQALGAHEVHGQILARWGALGWENSPLGYPITDELPAADGTGRYNHFQHGSIYWTPSTGAWSVRGAIHASWARLGYERSALGYPLTDELGLPSGGRYNAFQNGSIYWTPSTGAREVRGAIAARWSALGSEASVLGYPTTDELPTPGGTGRYNDFQHGSIYWTPSAGAWSVRGAILASWARLGYERSALGYPLTDELGLPSGGRYNAFQNGSIYWTPSTGAREVRGAIAARWSALGSEASVLGYPTTDELPTPGGTGRYNHFQHGSVYWTPAAGAHEVYGAIRVLWARNGSEAGRLGFPVTGEYSVPGGRRSDFQGGAIVYDAATGVARVL